MQLIAVPFTPTYAEYIFLKGGACWRIKWYSARALSAVEPAARAHPALAVLMRRRSA